MSQVCEIYRTIEDGQVYCGEFQWDGQEVQVKPVSGREALFKRLLAAPHRLKDGTTVTAEDKPEAWFASLPSNIGGSYLRAKMQRAPGEVIQQLLNQLPQNERTLAIDRGEHSAQSVEAFLLGRNTFRFGFWPPGRLPCCHGVQGRVSCF